MMKRSFHRIAVARPVGRRAILMVAALILMSACETFVEVDVSEDHEPKLVAIGLFSPDQSRWVVRVSHTLGITDTTSLNQALIDDADVNIMEKGGGMIRLRSEGYGRYVSDEEPPVPGETYVLRVTASGWGTVTATDSLPRQVAGMEAVVASGIDEPLTDDASARMVLRFKDPAGQTNYYHPYVLADLGGGLRRIEYDTPQQHAESEVVRRLDLAPNLTGNQRQIFFSGLYMSDDGFDGAENEVRMTFDRWPSNGYAGGLEIMSASYYRYLRSLMTLEDTRGNPFAEPARVFSNVEGGLGIFAGSIHQITERIRLHEITTETLAGAYEAVEFRLQEPSWVNVLGMGGSLSLELFPDGGTQGRLILPEDEGLIGNDVDIDLDGTFSYDGSDVRFSFNGESLLDQLVWEYSSVHATLRTNNPESDAVFIVLRRVTGPAGPRTHHK